MIVLDDKCEKCNCICNTMVYQQNFWNWTSDNIDIDEFIQSTQLSAHDNVKEALEWIPYNKLNNINYIAEGKLLVHSIDDQTNELLVSYDRYMKYAEFTKIYKANWVDGYIDKWNNENQNWKRHYKNMSVTLKSLNDPKKIIIQIMNEV
jgi:hypothetical protein